MPRFDFQSPGAAASDAIRAEMVRRAALERQEMLDQIARERETRLKEHDKASLEVQRENAAGLQEARASMIAQRDRQNAEGLTKVLRPGQEIGGEAADVLNKGLPGLVMESPKMAPTDNTPEMLRDPAQVPGVVATPEVSRKYAGTSQQQAMEGLNLPPDIKKLVEAGVLDGTALAKVLMGDDPPKVGSFEDYVIRKYGKTPTPEQITKAREDYRLEPVVPPILITTMTPEGQGVQKIVPRTPGSEFALGPTTDARNREFAVKRSQVVLDSISELSERINTLQGIEAKAVGEVEKAKAKLNYADDVAEYQALISGFTPLVARAVGHTGVLTEQDVQSVREMFPKPGDSKTLRDRKIARILKVMGAMNGEDTETPGPATPPPPSNPMDSLYDAYRKRQGGQ